LHQRLSSSKCDLFFALSTQDPAMREPRNRVVQVRRFGGPDGLEIIDAPLPTAGRGEVRVRVLASSLEYTDTLIRRHLYPQTAARRPPFVLGYGVVGQIDQLGDGVRDFQVGDRVADMTVLGSNADWIKINHQQQQTQQRENGVKLNQKQ
jgi:NADPH:quinone reductase-like Zn-dependent oxidoreductase